MKNKKRLFGVFLAFIIVLQLCGCNFYGNKAKLSSAMELDSTGIVEEKIFSKLKDNNSVVTITGYDDNIRYSWTVFGSDIKEPKKCNMLVHINIKDDESIEVKTESKEAFGFSPLLSIYVPKKWASNSATVYKSSGEALCTASLTSGNPTIVNFNMSLCGEKLTVIADKNINTSNDKDNDKKDKEKATDKNENKTKNSVDESYSNSGGKNSGNNKSKRTISDGSSKEKDKYLTDPVPQGKPNPVEPEDASVNKSQAHTCTISIECSTILNNIKNLKKNKLELVPSNGVILSKQTVTFYEGESVFDVLKRVCKDNGIQMESTFTAVYNSAYVEGIANLYEFDCGNLSGWMYRVNGWYPNYGCSRYQLKQGENIEWRYTCDLGRDVGCSWDVSGN